MQNVISRSGGHAEKAWFSETIKMRGSSHKHDHDITTHVPVYYIVAVIGGNVPRHSVEKKLLVRMEKLLAVTGSQSLF